MGVKESLQKTTANLPCAQLFFAPPVFANLAVSLFASCPCFFLIRSVPFVPPCFSALCYLLCGVCLSVFWFDAKFASLARSVFLFVGDCFFNFACQRGMLCSRIWLMAGFWMKAGAPAQPRIPAESARRAKETSREHQEKPYSRIC